MPDVGLGLAAVGRPGYINLNRNQDIAAANERSEDFMRQRAEEVLDAAWAAGVRWFDAARSYGLAEDFLGTWLRKRGIKPEEVCVSSKWGYRYTADWKVDTGGQPHEVKDHSLPHLIAQIPETLSTVGEYVRLYQIHSATFDSGVLENAEVHAALGKLRSERGWSLGLSVSSPAQGEIIDAALALKDPTDSTGDRKLFDSVQATFNILEQAAGPALERAHKAGLDIIVKEAVANWRACAHPKLCEAAQALTAEWNLNSVCITPDQLALACVLAQSFQPFVLSGAVTCDQLRSNLRAAEIAEHLRKDPVRLSNLMASCRQESVTYWKERGALAWN
eukprot:gnl/MRDRNA2_/MRDRNA2_244759_c0_seq1.p1 gnl/MRDRNA2_/MRDRNA2_244759_c0~~gnl/MRDRNA2_/MRDRNA2_244759_c0_seq1.p1  ORF type:complete len:343 (-),score=52.09 gnl/MRDRNA2_/MRDRNA2_244759_c0_seq1:78-1079(-)